MDDEIASWVLQEKVLPNVYGGGEFDDDWLQSNFPTSVFPGGERWAGIGVEFGDLAFSNARELLKPDEFGRAFQNLDPGPAMDNVWENVTDLSINKLSLLISKKDKITKLSVWAPGSMFSNPVERTYFIYHPLVLETKGEKPNGGKSWFLVGYNRSHGSGDVNRDWTSLPTIDFLPADKVLNDRRIIAGSAGLLVVDGGLQGSTQKLKLWGRTQVPNENFWKHPEIYKNSQSLVFITNPLTREYVILPPLPGRLMNKKIGKFIWRNRERTSYVLILIGWDAEVESGSNTGKYESMAKKMAKKRKGFGEKIGIFVYCSEDKCYMYCDEIEGRPLPFRHLGSSGIGVIGYGVFVGGMKVTKSKAKDDKHPCVYYFNISNSSNIRKTMIPFVVDGIPDSTNLQAPKVVQGGSARIFAITQAMSAATTLHVVEIVLDDELRHFQSFHLNTSMPKQYFRKLFTKLPCNDIYEVSGCKGVISFKAAGPGNAVVLYDVNKEQWLGTNFPKQKHAKVADYHLADATYEPNFRARP